MPVLLNEAPSAIATAVVGLFAIGCFWFMAVGDGTRADHGLVCFVYCCGSGVLTLLRVPAGRVEVKTALED